MSFTAKHDKKRGYTMYTYRGDIKENIEKAKKELNQKEDSEKGRFLLWQYNEAKKKLDAYEQRIKDLKGFIATAERKLQAEAKNETDQ